MKLIKYIINLIILTVSLVFLFKLSALNDVDGENLLIKIPSGMGQEYQEFEVWVVVLGILTVGVLLGFFIALFQILAQKGELMSVRSRLKRLQIEIDNLRNESIDEDTILTDSDNHEGQ
jgi:hypothetical protein